MEWWQLCIVVVIVSICQFLMVLVGAALGIHTKDK